MPPAIAPTYLASDRLTLQALHEVDARAVRELWLRNRELLRESFPGTVSQVAERDDVAGYLADRAASWLAGTGFWYGVSFEDRIVGQVHVKSFDWSVAKAELAYFIDAACQRRGLATEAVLRVVRMCREELQLVKLFLRTVAGNQASAAVARRCGFVHEGTLRGEFLAGGELRCDVHYYGLLPCDA